LEANAPSKYWLSPKACAGILRRADKRGKDLPPALATALQQVAQSPANKTTANENYNLVATHVPEKSACLETTNHDYSRADGFTAISYGFYANEGSHGMGDNREVSPAIKIGSGLGIPSPPAVALEVAGTLGGGSGQRGWSNDLDRNGAFIPESTSVVRRLTPVECCRLQGFPDDWNSEGIDAKGKRFSMADAPRYRQLGNAVTVNVANWIANNLVKAYEVAE
jgi:DNA (cytosine-5)-methyltransferase 1